jgi:hypothetical protein
VDHYPSLKFAAASCQKRKYFKKNTPSTRRRVGAYLKFPKKEIFQTKKITINSPASGRLFEISKNKITINSPASVYLFEISKKGNFACPRTRISPRQPPCLASPPSLAA